MLERTYSYKLSYKLNFIPGAVFILFILALVVTSRSTTKIYGYFSVMVLLLSFFLLTFFERKKVASKITVSDKGITADKLLSDDIFIKWHDIECLRYAGRGVFLASGKLEKYLYGEVIASDKNKIVFRRELNGFHELIKEIQDRSGKIFLPEDNVK